jgi:hypothetical protein
MNKAKPTNTERSAKVRQRVRAWVANEEFDPVAEYIWLHIGSNKRSLAGVKNSLSGLLAGKTVREPTISAIENCLLERGRPRKVVPITEDPPIVKGRMAQARRLARGVTDHPSAHSGKLPRSFTRDTFGYLDTKLPEKEWRELITRKYWEYEDRLKEENVG